MAELGRGSSWHLAANRCMKLDDWIDKGMNVHCLYKATSVAQRSVKRELSLLGRDSSWQMAANHHMKQIDWFCVTTLQGPV